MAPREIPVAIGAADKVEERADIPFLDAHHGDDLLRQDVEAVLRNRGPLDVVLFHGPRDDRRLDEVLGMRGVYPSLAFRVGQMSRPSDPLQTAGDPFRRL